jgi:hypothetical protein
MKRSIRNLYTYALAEGEGVGTAYEYYVKRRIMRSVLAQAARRSARESGAHVLVAGLPEKYGTSLDFVLAASELEAKVLVVDDRADAIDRARGAIDPLLASGKIPRVAVEYRKLDAMSDLASVGPQDVVLSCEVIQRLPDDQRAAYARSLRALAPRGVVFVPNGENASHTKISGLRGLDRATLRSLMGAGVREVGFTDLPPFPPGITRSADQREQASSGAKEAVGMWGLQMYSAAEPYLPSSLKRHVAHIVYAKWEG